MMTWAQINFQDAASPMMEEFIFFHDFTMTVILFILIFVGCIMALMLKGQWVNTGLLEGQTVECIWTLLPALILTQIAIPSLLLLYMMDDLTDPDFTLKIEGHQWYWTYEYGDDIYSVDPVESRMLPDDESCVRLLDVDSRMPVPVFLPIRGLVTSADVLHSWAIPSLGVKADACPGRLNQVTIQTYRYGVWYGQCSEICGANHSFMPIVLESVDADDFIPWVQSIGYSGTRAYYP